MNNIIIAVLIWCSVCLFFGILGAVEKIPYIDKLLSEAVKRIERSGKYE